MTLRGKRQQPVELQGAGGRFGTHCFRRFMAFGMWHCIVGWIVPDVSKVVPSNHREPFTQRHSATSQKTCSFSITAVRRWRVWASQCCHTWQHSTGKCVCSKCVMHFATSVKYSAVFPSDLPEICRKADKAEGRRLSHFVERLSPKLHEKNDRGDRPWVSNPRPAATFLNCVYTTNLHNNIAGYVYHTAWFFYLLPMLETTIKNVLIVINNFWDVWPGLFQPHFSKSILYVVSVSFHLSLLPLQTQWYGTECFLW